MTDLAAVTQALRVQAGACAAFGSPFSADLLGRAATDVEQGRQDVARFFAPWAGKDTRALLSDAAPLRWLGALHDIVLAHPDSPLAAAYPGENRAGDAAAAWPLVQEAMGRQAARIAAFMSHEPQTNEVLRSSALLPGFLTMAGETGLPLRLLEIGASAGLNQLWDRYRHRLGDWGEWGPTASTVRLASEWRGARPPLEQAVRVIERRACDRAPVDLADPAQRRRLRAFVWADQHERLARLTAAIETALAANVRVERADAIDFLRAHAAPRAGVATVVFHSVVFQYLAPASQEALAQVIATHGVAATASAPLAWLRMEPQPGNLALMELRVTTWPGGEERLLGHAHPHAAWTEWLGA
jgi:hypothetical protein